MRAGLRARRATGSAPDSEGPIQTGSVISLGAMPEIFLTGMTAAFGHGEPGAFMQRPTMGQQLVAPS